MLGDDHPDTLAAMDDLAATMQASGDAAAAREVYEQLLDALRRTLGDDHPDTLAVMDDLVVILRALGDLAVARELHERAHAGRRRALDNWERMLAEARQERGDEVPFTLRMIDDVAVERYAFGDLSGARELQEEALATRRRVLGDDDRDTLTTMENLAATLYALGDLGLL